VVHVSPLPSNHIANDPTFSVAYMILTLFLSYLIALWIKVGPWEDVIPLCSAMNYEDWKILLFRSSQILCSEPINRSQETIPQTGEIQLHNPNHEHNEAKHGSNPATETADAHPSSSQYEPEASSEDIYETPSMPGSFPMASETHQQNVSVQEAALPTLSTIINHIINQIASRLQNYTIAHVLLLVFMSFFAALWLEYGRLAFIWPCGVLAQKSQGFIRRTVKHFGGTALYTALVPKDLIKETEEKAKQPSIPQQSTNRFPPKMREPPETKSFVLNLKRRAEALYTSMHDRPLV